MLPPLDGSLDAAKSRPAHNGKQVSLLEGVSENLAAVHRVPSACT